MSSLQSTYITPEEYLERERAAETRTEYFRGELFAMAGATPEHVLIVTNLVGELRQHLRDRPCNVYSTDLRVAVSSTGLYTYPDVTVVCGPAAFVDSRRDTVTNPVVIIEVLSESTKDYDRGQKFEGYRTVTSLMEYLTVAQDKMHIEQWTRQPDQRWLLTEYTDPEAVMPLSSIDVELRLADVYEKVEVPPA
jgi:Uma2 family endonuclease